MEMGIIVGTIRMVCCWRVACSPSACFVEEALDLLLLCNKPFHFSSTFALGNLVISGGWGVGSIGRDRLLLLKMADRFRGIVLESSFAFATAFASP